MSSKPPTISKPATGVASNSPAPTESPKPEGTSRVDGSVHQRYLRALGDIESHPRTSTQLRSILTPYYRLSNAKLTTEHLPRSLRRHPRKPDRSMDSGRDALLAFHLGSAADYLQRAYRADQEYMKVPASKVDDKIVAKALVEGLIRQHAEAVAHIEKLAAVGTDQWAVVGDDSTGYALVVAKE